MIKGFSEYINEQYANPKDLPMLKYGNPQKEHMDKMNKGSDLYSSVKDTDLWKKWTNSVPPLQSSDEAKKSIDYSGYTANKSYLTKNPNKKGTEEYKQKEDAVKKYEDDLETRTRPTEFSTFRLSPEKDKG
jgi:hypothetical protein